MENLTLRAARLDFNEQGTPVSRDFDDVYFSNDNGAEETRYVFLKGNGLPDRLTTAGDRPFVVAETGFGTGLNFLTLWEAFHRACSSPLDDKQAPRLHVISVEKYPLTRDDLIRAHEAWPELQAFASPLQQQWPDHLLGCHRLLFDSGRVTLDLWFGDVNTLLPVLGETHQQQVDAWFLDGFAPAKNPDMWTPTLFSMMAKLGRPGCTFSTFTSAGFVRRGLIEAGFEVKKCKGFGRKREMLTGVLPRSLPRTNRTPWYHRGATEKKDVALIGGGIASALLSLALLRRGWQVTLYCQDEQAAEGASGNRQGALYPLLNAHDPALTRFFSLAFTFARRLYDQLPVDFEHDWCGVTQLAWDEKSARKIAQMLALDLPDSVATPLDATAIEKVCGLTTGCDGITYPAGGWLCPADLTRATLHRAIEQGLTVHFNHRITGLTAQPEGWSLESDKHADVSHGTVVLAGGYQINQFEQTSALPIYAVAGQVSHIPTTPQLSQLRQVLCYDGYLTPVSPRNSSHCIGASYHRGSTDTHYNETDQLENKARLVHCLPNSVWVENIDVSEHEARNGVRCAIRDHLPLVGQVPDYEATLFHYRNLAMHPEEAVTAPVFPGLFLLGALGSRGLCSAPLSAEILAAQMSGEPLPMDSTTLAALSPNRFWVRKLLKGKAVRPND